MDRSNISKSLPLSQSFSQISLRIEWEGQAQKSAEALHQDIDHSPQRPNWCTRKEQT